MIEIVESFLNGLLWVVNNHLELVIGSVGILGTVAIFLTSRMR